MIQFVIKSDGAVGLSGETCQSTCTNCTFLSRSEASRIYGEAALKKDFVITGKIKCASNESTFCAVIVLLKRSD